MPIQDTAQEVIGAIEEVTGLDPKAAVIVLAVLVILAIFILTKPIRFALKLLINTLVGFVALFLIDRFGAQFGIAIDLNWINAAVTGILGIPGVAVLLVLKWMGVM